MLVECQFLGLVGKTLFIVVGSVFHTGMRIRGWLALLGQLRLVRGYGIDPCPFSTLRKHLTTSSTHPSAALNGSYVRVGRPREDDRVLRQSNTITTQVN